MFDKVNPSHPDKVADRNSKVACEAFEMGKRHWLFCK